MIRVALLVLLAIFVPSASSLLFGTSPSVTKFARLRAESDGQLYLPIGDDMRANSSRKDEDFPTLTVNGAPILLDKLGPVEN